MHEYRIAEEGFDGFAPAILRYKFAEMWDIILGYWRAAVVKNEGRLVQCQLCDFVGEQTRGLQGQHRAGGMPEYKRCATRLVDQRLDVFDLALDSIRRGVAAVAPASPIMDKHGEMRCQDCGQ